MCSKTYLTQQSGLMYYGMLCDQYNMKSRLILCSLEHVLQSIKHRYNSGVARLFKLVVSSKIVGGGHAKKQATKKRYHFITLGGQQSRSELLRTGGTSAVGTESL